MPLDIIIERLTKRAREPRGTKAFSQRIERAKKNLHFRKADVVIDNSGSIESAAIQLLYYMKLY